MTEKRYRTERIEGASLPFIVDNYSAKKLNETSTGYKAYDTNTVKKCDELTDLLNNYEKENEQLKSQREDLKRALSEKDENKRYEFDVMNGGGYVVGYSERMSDDISFFTRLCEVPTKTQAEKVCNELKGLQKENEQLKQFQDNVFSWIDMHLQRLPTLRDDEFESDNEFADPSLYSGAIQILETMKRELKR